MGRKGAPWSAEEDALLLEIFRSPGLERLWNQKARKEGWPPRSYKSLKQRVNSFGEKFRYADETAGWVTASQLQRCLNIGSTQPIWRWKRMGLPVYRDGDHATSPLKIHLHDFVVWCLGCGSEEIAHSIRGDQAAVTWLLHQIADWRDYKIIKMHGGHLPQAKPIHLRRENHDTAV